MGCAPPGGPPYDLPPVRIWPRFSVRHTAAYDCQVGSHVRRPLAARVDGGTVAGHIGGTMSPSTKDVSTVRRLGASPLPATAGVSVARDLDCSRAGPRTGRGKG